MPIKSKSTVEPSRATGGSTSRQPTHSHIPSPMSSRCKWVVSSGSSSEVYGGKVVASESWAAVVVASKGPTPEGSSGGSFQRVGTEPCGYSAGRQAPTVAHGLMGMGTPGDSSSSAVCQVPQDGADGG